MNKFNREIKIDTDCSFIYGQRVKNGAVLKRRNGAQFRIYMYINYVAILA